jgi:hypothetical protein
MSWCESGGREPHTFFTIRTCLILCSLTIQNLGRLSHCKSLQIKQSCCQRPAATSWSSSPSNCKICGSAFLSLQGLRALNAVGYGQPDSGLVLDLVYNPGGAFLAPPQEKLQPAYKQELEEVTLNPRPPPTPGLTSGGWAVSPHVPLGLQTCLPRHGCRLCCLDRLQAEQPDTRGAALPYHALLHCVFA